MADSLIKKIPRTPLANKMFQNLGDLKFKDVGNDWGLAKPSFSNSVAYADLDGDGDLDMIVNNENQPAFVYQNHAREINKNHYVSISLKANASNGFGIGSVVKIFVGKDIFYRELEPVRGFQSSVDYTLVIGLGKDSLIDSMQVRWPDRRVSNYVKPAVDTHYHLDEKDAKQNFLAEKFLAKTIFDTIPNIFEKHKEDDFVDFYNERNLPEMLSREGPQAAVGDVDGDGLQDIYVGGAAGQAGQLYLQTKDGKFVKKTEKIFDEFASFEDVAVAFFDADNDGDLDLFIGPGGNNQASNSREIQLRLYKNDGKGNFSLDAEAFPMNAANISVAKVCDFNGDGNLDLFVGARSVPGQYGVTPTCHLLVNNGKGHFTEFNAPEIANAGMVTGAAWADMDGDKKPDLVVVGEWINPRIFYNRGNYFEEKKGELDALQGWWQTVQVADLNGDGKMDLVLGNIGENFYLKPDANNPVKLWLQDFDKNGTVEKIISYTVNGKDMPVFLKHEMEDQLPIIKKQNLLHAGYANKSIQDLFGADVLKASVVKGFSYASSCVAINLGHGNFEINKLPIEAQLSSVNAISVFDANNDGHPDLLVGGNLTNFLPQFGRLDANFGQLFLNDGKGNFSLVNYNKTGLVIRGEIRDIERINVGNKKCFLFLRNDDFPVLVGMNNEQ